MYLEFRKVVENFIDFQNGDEMNFRKDVVEKFSFIKVFEYKKVIFYLFKVIYDYENKLVGGTRQLGFFYNFFKVR